MSPLSTSQDEQDSTISADATTDAPHHVMRFYQNNYLVTELSTQGNRHIAWGADTPLIQLEQAKAAKMLQVDLANSVLSASSESVAYSPYGYPTAGREAVLLEFNGQPWDPVSQSYPLGRGYRQYLSSMMRFCSPDTLSPFDKGGLNAYAYCAGDPINNTDPSGHVKSLLKLITGRYKFENLKSRAQFGIAEIKKTSDIKYVSFTETEKKTFEKNIDRSIDFFAKRKSKYELRMKPVYDRKTHPPATPRDHQNLSDAKEAIGYLNRLKQLMTTEVIVEGKTRYTIPDNKVQIEKFLNEKNTESAANDTKKIRSQS